jgi:hypothetical protein
LARENNRNIKSIDTTDFASASDGGSRKTGLYFCRSVRNQTTSRLYSQTKEVEEEIMTETNVTLSQGGKKLELKSHD